MFLINSHGVLLLGRSVMQRKYSPLITQVFIVTHDGAGRGGGEVEELKPMCGLIKI